MHPSAKAANLATCEILPDASLIATTFLTSFAILTAVSGRMFAVSYTHLDVYKRQQYS